MEFVYLWYDLSCDVRFINCMTANFDFDVWLDHIALYFAVSFRQMVSGNQANA